MLSGGASLFSFSIRVAEARRPLLFRSERSSLLFRSFAYSSRCIDVMLYSTVKAGSSLVRLRFAEPGAVLVRLLFIICLRISASSSLVLPSFCVRFLRSLGCENLSMPPLRMCLNASARDTLSRPPASSIYHVFAVLSEMLVLEASSSTTVSTSISSRLASSVF